MAERKTALTDTVVGYVEKHPGCPYHNLYRPLRVRRAGIRSNSEIDRILSTQISKSFIEICNVLWRVYLPGDELRHRRLYEIVEVNSVDRVDLWTVNIFDGHRNRLEMFGEHSRFGELLVEQSKLSGSSSEEEMFFYTIGDCLNPLRDELKERGLIPM